MTLVLDASYAVAILLDEELGDVAEVRRRMAEDDNVAPVPWWFEVANALLVAVRRGRATMGELPRCFATLRAFRITADHEGLQAAWARTFELAGRHSLTIYDAAYLELAVRRRAFLASLDRQLVAAARAESVDTLAPPS